MARSKSSEGWLKEHFDDEYVKRSQKEGYRSRAVYKLKEIQQKDKLIKPNMQVVDLGAAPGGWSQYAVELVGKNGRVVASDILPLDPLPFVEFIQGDFTEESVLNDILDVLYKDEKNTRADVIISDMAPNITGVETIDQPKSVYLCELSLDMARQILKKNGSFVVKLFQGDGSDAFVKDVKSSFKQVKIRKPKASRARSREVYVVAQGFIDN
ncbi:MAG TPA: 23S rRNA (uridine(2552)-2'-O)-methyltransferase RlmE [Leucothrix mucor]|nr:23S rRNA (uridine(2552)-2'-O)-methyltransferase RlmE [Leucothrix mucor]